MNKVISINLGGRAYQLEEEGYQLLQAYLTEAAARLGDDPDKDEILSDIEQALAEKFSRLLNSNKTVIVTKEVKMLIDEMGQVESDNSKPEAASKGADKNSSKRLYRIMEGKVIGGVCTGLAAYFDVDVVLIRIIFVALIFITQGAWIFVYLVMMLAIPKAKTSEELAKAYGDDFTARDLVKRAKAEFAEFADKSEWKKWKHELRQKIRQQRREWRQCEKSNNDGNGFFGILILIFIIFWLFGLVSILTTGMILGFFIPATWPLWLVVLGWLVLLPIIVDPLSKAKNGTGHCHGGGIFSLLWVVLVGWLVWQFVPESHQYFREGYEAVNRAIEAIKRG